MGKVTELSSLTLSNCNEILQKYLKTNNVKASKFEVKTLSGKIAGMMGKHLILNVTYQDNNGPTTVQFFVKSITDLNNPLVSYFQDVHEKEVLLYDFLDRCNQLQPGKFTVDVVPQLYWQDPISKTLVMEDLTLKGYYMPKTKIVDEEHMLVALKSVAKFHAASIIYEEAQRTKLGRVYRLTEEFGDLLKEGTFSRQHKNGYRYTMAAIEGMCAVTDELDEDEKLTRDKFKLYIRKAVEKMFDLMEDKTTYRCVCNHGDLWSKNMLFSYETSDKLVPIHAQLVDYQLVRYVPPALDVTMLIHHTLDTKTFKRAYNTCLEFYYKCLDEILMEAGLIINTIYPKSEFNETCKIYMHVTKMIKAIYRTMTAATDEVFTNLCKDVEKFDKYMFEDRSQFVLDNFRNDVEYRNQIIDIMEDIKVLILEDFIV